MENYAHFAARLQAGPLPDVPPPVALVLLMTAYKALVFDLGKVVFDLSFDRVFQSWATASNAPYDALKSMFKFDALFERFERNEIAPVAFRAALCDRLGLTLTDPQFDEGWSALYLGVYPGVEALLAQLGRRY